MGNASDFQLPEEILRVMPTDPYEQLDIARKITSIAIASRVSRLEAENLKLKQKVYEKDQIIHDLNDKLSQLDLAFQDTNARLSRALEDESKLMNERNALASTVKKLNRDVAKLEAFKRTLMQSLNEDDEIAPENSTTYQSENTSSSNNSSLREGMTNGTPAVQTGYLANETSSASKEDIHGEYGGSRQRVQRFSLTPFLTPRRSPTGTPTTISTAGSPKRSSSLPSPKGRSVTSSPTNRSRESRMSSALPPHHATAPNSPPRNSSFPARTPRVDGKEFFRQARSRLSIEQFSAFLANIKELNAHRQNKEETLRKAQEIFGSENKDLYIAFEGLLSRHLQ